MTYTTDLDALMKKLGDKVPDPDVLVSENAGAAAKRLFEFLKSIKGKYYLSGQQYLQREELEDDIYFARTGKLPAIRGYDLMDMDKRNGDDQIDRALWWAKETGAVITLCWHWYAPDDMDDMDACMWSFYYKTTSYDHKTSFDIRKAVQEGTREHGFVVSRIDKAAEILKRFEKEDIPVLFRPLHEANGAWFWWGRREGADREESVKAYKKLWYMIFDRLENYHRVKGLIWVWNGQDREMLVHPNTFDICGDDIYSAKENDHSSQKERFEYMCSLSGGKLVTLSECGFIPRPSEMAKDGVSWLWWLPWWGGFVYERGGKEQGFAPQYDEGGRLRSSEKYMPAGFLEEVFADDRCLSLCDLPFFKGEASLPEKFRKKK